MFVEDYDNPIEKKTKQVIKFNSQSTKRWRMKLKKNQLKKTQYWIIKFKKKFKKNLKNLSRNFHEINLDKLSTLTIN
jgi:hypothetical protein